MSFLSCKRNSRVFAALLSRCIVNLVLLIPPLLQMEEGAIHELSGIVRFALDQVVHRSVIMYAGIPEVPKHLRDRVIVQSETSKKTPN